MPGRRVPVPPAPLLTPYFPKYAKEEESDDPTTETEAGSGLRALLSGAISAIFGGSTPYLAADEAWPRCKTCGHALIPYLQISLSSVKTPAEFRAHVAPLHPALGDDADAGAGAGATLLQVFICAEETNAGFCFEAWTMHVEEGESWLVRKVRVGADAIAARQGDPELAAAHEEARAKLEEEEQLIPERVIEEWTPGNPETEHWEAGEGDPEDPAYQAHEPADGLKLLGYAVRGKYYYSSVDNELGLCAAGDGDPHFAWRCLVQLGTRDEDNPIYTTGNIYIDQCAQHPDVLAAVCSGTW